MISCVHGFLTYHAAVGQRVLLDHFNFKPDSDEAGNLFMVKEENSKIETCVRLVGLRGRVLIINDLNMCIVNNNKNLV